MTGSFEKIIIEKSNDQYIWKKNKQTIITIVETVHIDKITEDYCSNMTISNVW